VGVVVSELTGFFFARRMQSDEKNPVNSLAAAARIRAAAPDVTQSALRRGRNTLLSHI